MKILIDENLPRKLTGHLPGHDCRTVISRPPPLIPVIAAVGEFVERYPRPMTHPGSITSLAACN